jgi:hypothetical protein
MKYWDVRLVLKDDEKPDGPLPKSELLEALDHLPLPAGVTCRVIKLREQDKRKPRVKKDRS